MGRSLKKGPFADAHLLKKVEAQADSEKKLSSKHGHVVQPFSQVLLVTHSLFMMVGSTYQFTFKKTWLVISLANLYQLVLSMVMELTIRKQGK
jgi:ribosomal protein S19